MLNRKRVLIVTRNLPPLVGGMERLNWHIADELSQHAEVRVIGPEGASALRPLHVQLHEVPLRPLWKFLFSSAQQAVRIARSWHPDVVLAGSGLTAPAAWAAARATRTACAGVYLHGLDATVQHPAYRALWYPTIRRMDKIIANSHTTAQLAINLGVMAQRLSIIHPGVHIPSAPQSTAILHDFRQRHGLGEACILLSVGRLTTRKGLREFVAHVLPKIIQQRPDVLLVVVGDAPVDALHATFQTRESIQAAADAVGVGAHLRFLGTITDTQELAAAYENAALHVFPVRTIPNDVEGFGMVAIEAATHGLATVAYATGGITDAVSEKVSGRLVPADDSAAFAQAVLETLQNPLNPDGIRQFAQRFAWPEFGKSIAQVLLQHV